MAIGYAHQAAVFDNTLQGDTGSGLREQAALADTRLIFTAPTPSAWVRRLVEQVNTRANELRAITRAVEANGLPVQLARLSDGRTSGPIVLVNQHYVLQYDERSRTTVVHDRALLGALASPLVPRESTTLHYKDGVAAATAHRGRAHGD